jgi:hypothetical protein
MRPEILADHLGATLRGLLDPLALRVAALETAGGHWTERLAGLEARTPLAGPPGPPGPPGRDGLDGKDGQSVRYLGVHVAGKTYDVGDLVTAGGSAWYCGRTTTGDPGKSADWQLMVKRGRDARERSER